MSTTKAASRLRPWKRSSPGRYHDLEQVRASLAAIYLPVMTEVCRRYGCDPSDISSVLIRRPAVVRAREELAYRLRTPSMQPSSVAGRRALSWWEIAACMGRTTHSGMLAAAGRYEDRMSSL